MPKLILPKFVRDVFFEVVDSKNCNLLSTLNNIKKLSIKIFLNQDDKKRTTKNKKYIFSFIPYIKGVLLENKRKIFEFHGIFFYS